MKFVHFTAVDGKTVAVNAEDVVEIRPPLEGADPHDTGAVISLISGAEVKVRDTVSAVEERLSNVADPDRH